MTRFKPFHGYHGTQGFHGIRALGDGEDAPAGASGRDVAMVGSQTAMQVSGRIGGGHVDPKVDSALAIAATVSAVLPPPADIVGLVATGVASLAVHLFAHKISRKQALALAHKMHIPHARDVAGWTRRAIAASPKHRDTMLRHALAQLKRKKKHKKKHGIGKALDALTHPATAARKTDRLQLKLAVIRAVIAADKASRRGMIGPRVKQPGLLPTEGAGLGAGGSLPELAELFGGGITPWVVGGALLFIVVAAASKSSRSKARD